MSVSSSRSASNSPIMYQRTITNIDGSSIAQITPIAPIEPIEPIEPIDTLPITPDMSPRVSLNPSPTPILSPLSYKDKHQETTVQDVISQEFEDWTYYPRLINPDLYSQLKSDLLDAPNGSFLSKYKINMKGNVFESRRLSAIFTKKMDYLNTNFRYTVLSYDNIPSYNWDQMPVNLNKIADTLCQVTGITFDYLLIHFYRNGNDMINFHADREALNTPVASVSLGVTRKFRFRKINQTRGWTHEYELQSGDVLIMKSGCQRKYKHSVPATKKVHEGRLNFTFRQYE